MIPGAPHGEGTQRVTPNRLQERFQSNKRESINQSHHKCFLGGRSEELSQGAKSYTSNVSHNQTLVVILAWSAWKGVRREGLKDRNGKPERGGVSGSRYKFFSKEIEAPTR
jgi:hypothetical protein